MIDIVKGKTTHPSKVNTPVLIGCFFGSGEQDAGDDEKTEDRLRVVIEFLQFVQRSETFDDPLADFSFFTLDREDSK